MVPALEGAEACCHGAKGPWRVLLFPRGHGQQTRHVPRTMGGEVARSSQELSAAKEPTKPLLDGPCRLDRAGMVRCSAAQLPYACVVIAVAATPTAKDKGEEPTLNGKAGVVTAVKAPARGAGGLLRSCPSEGQKSFLPPLFPHCRGLFIGSKACLCRVSNSSGMFGSDAAEEPECLVR
mmetsp:Transcript_10361/g.25397  ORF Transcript_10361/g.25397 Transcript_10361/m.25397 type:complete len:179 (-) Transcript_10361:977-1513(-)